MSLDDYKLSAQLVGHSMDVRSVAVVGKNIVSGSRDRTCKIWQHDGGFSSWSERYTLTDHRDFVSAVCVLGDDEWICTGSKDKSILIYATGSKNPFKRLVGHTDTVSCLAPGLQPNTLISGSWDYKVIVWKWNGLEEPAKMELNGHEAAVWAVTTMASGKYVSGGADKNIIVWSSTGERLKVIKGSLDCVRSLLSLPNDYLISAGNDAIIRYWNEDGECIKELSGHTNFIFSLAFNKALGANIIVSGSEDSTLRMWNENGEFGSAITLPALSVWSVACMKNGDIVTGSSDGIVRVFTKDPSRVASDELIAIFGQAVEAHICEISKKIGDVNVKDLVGPEALFKKGKRDGETKMIRQPDGKVMCYQWNGGRWEEIGDVVGASGGSGNISGKKSYLGKEYDFVFDVNIADDSPTLKLPYNRSDDPYVSAQKFIHENELPQTYLDQVANFIITNAKPLPMTGAGQSNEYLDPFTGAGRYIPGSSSDEAAGGMNVDPFTGGSSYSTSSSSSVPVNFVPRSGQNLDPFTGASSHTSQLSPNPPRKLFPYPYYTQLDACDPDKVLNKMRAFNEQVPESSRLSEEELLLAIKLAKKDYTASSSIDALKKLLEWPTEYLFPVLDIVRLAVLDPNTCTNLVTPTVLDFIIHNCNTGAANQLMSLRCLSNMLIHGYGRGLIETVLQNVLTTISVTKKGTSNLQMAIATALQNLSVAQLKRANELTCHLITETLIDFLLWTSDSESLFRSYRSLGNLLTTTNGASVCAKIISTDKITKALVENVKAPQSYEFDKINQIAQEIMDALGQI